MASARPHLLLHLAEIAARRLGLRTAHLLAAADVIARPLKERVERFRKRAKEKAIPERKRVVPRESPSERPAATPPAAAPEAPPAPAEKPAKSALEEAMEKARKRVEKKKSG